METELTYTEKYLLENIKDIKKLALCGLMPSAVYPNEDFLRYTLKNILILSEQVIKKITDE